MAEKKFYWLKLKEDFFRQKEIKKLRKIAGGDTYTIIYLKMQLLSLRNEGILYYEGTEETFEEQLSLEIDEDIDNVKVTLAFLFNNNLIEEISDNEFVLSKASECIGKEGSSAKRMRKLRENQVNKQIKGQTTLQCDTVVTDGDKNVTTEREIERREKRKEIDIEKEIENKSSVVVSNIEVFKYFEQCGFLLSAIQMDLIVADIEVYSAKWLMDAAEHSVKAGKINYNYVQGILRNWKAEGRKENKDGATSKSKKNTESEGPKYNFDSLYGK
ncbi:MAG: phage replisome organizer N-terminal domain-containing protein [Clostridium sp.]|uniref:phage replisome organizer N-terminal domain-containing protein n=1 Tax=Clostridium sp. TaxID=1506 RepID=UPI0029023507|nr:phage replisome organizer N-terminal domain-containing protein [Clostridium sp.]MDU1232553.1 phage replisome organizer N-terminal domain-containing protein [Clostridium sp.]